MRLISALPKEYENKVRLALIELLESSLEIPDDGYFKLPYTKGKNRHARDGKRWMTVTNQRILALRVNHLMPQSPIRSESKYSPLHDYVFLAFMYMAQASEIVFRRSQHDRRNTVSQRTTRSGVASHHRAARPAVLGYYIYDLNG